LIPEHGDASEISPDSTGMDQLTDDIDNSLNVHESSGLVGKFRSSLKKKVSIKGVSAFVKTPPRPAARKPRDEMERTEEEDGGEERSPEREKSENVDDVEVEKSVEEVQELQETVETTPEEGVEAKKKKKKKKRRARDEEQEVEMVESTPAKTGEVTGGASVQLPDFAESPVVSVETEEMSYEVSSAGKTKKTKRRTHKKTTHHVEVEDGEQVF